MVTSLTRRPIARLIALLVAFVAVLFVAVGPWVIIEASTPPLLRDARSLATATIGDHRPPATPSDGVTPVTPARLGDIAPAGRNRARWFGDLIGSLVLLAAWGATRRAWFRQSRSVLPAGRTWSARSLGRAPPVATIS